MRERNEETREEFKVEKKGREREEGKKKDIETEKIKCDRSGCEFNYSQQIKFNKTQLKNSFRF